MTVSYSIDKSMITTAGEIPGYTVVRVEGIVNSFMSLPSLSLNWENSYSKIKNELLGKLIREAKELGANAIVGIGFSSFSRTHWPVEIIAYGTAVYVEKK